MTEYWWISQFALGWFWIPRIALLPANVEPCLCTSPSLYRHTQSCSTLQNKTKGLHHDSKTEITLLPQFDLLLKGTLAICELLSIPLKYSGIGGSRRYVNWMLYVPQLLRVFARTERLFFLSYIRADVLRRLKYSVRLCCLNECPLKLIMQLTDTSNTLPDSSLAATYTAVWLKLELDASLHLHIEEQLRRICHCFLSF